jgi:tetrahydromethanopterin S-methyltransferase subunit F
MVGRHYTDLRVVPEVGEMGEARRGVRPLRDHAHLVTRPPRTSHGHVPTRSRAGMAQGMGIGIVMIFCLALAVAAVVIYFFVVGGTSAASGRDTASVDAPAGETETDREQRRSREGERPEHTAVQDKTHAAGIRDE